MVDSVQCGGCDSVRGSLRQLSRIGVLRAAIVLGLAFLACAAVPAPAFCADSGAGTAASPAAAPPSDSELPDIEITATIHADSMNFRTRPETSVNVSGPLPGSGVTVRRNNLPRDPRPGFLYQDILFSIDIRSLLKDVQQKLAQQPAGGSATTAAGASGQAVAPTAETDTVPGGRSAGTKGTASGGGR